MWSIPLHIWIDWFKLNWSLQKIFISICRIILWFSSKCLLWIVENYYWNWFLQFLRYLILYIHVFRRTLLLLYFYVKCLFLFKPIFSIQPDTNWLPLMLWPGPKISFMIFQSYFVRCLLNRHGHKIGQDKIGADLFWAYFFWLKRNDHIWNFLDAS